MIAGLSDLLRRVLDESGKQEVSLGEEMEFLERISKSRKHGSPTACRSAWMCRSEFHNARVPSLILQPMVENAIEHGIGSRAAGGAIRIGAVRNNGFLTLSVYNEGPRIPENWEEQRDRSRNRECAGAAAESLWSGRVISISATAMRASKCNSLFPYKAEISVDAVLLSRIRALVVDDEPLARANVLHLLRANPEVEIVGECGSAAAALEAIRAHKPDLVFLDVRMPEYDGFDMLEMLGAEAPPAVIFVTAYDQYALQAFDAGALDYLLKPFNNARIARAFDRARERLAHAASRSREMERLPLRMPDRLFSLTWPTSTGSKPLTIMLPCMSARKHICFGAV